MIYRALRVCSPKKDMSGRTLKSVYIEPMLQAYFHFMESHHIPYAILSRKYGICLDTECYIPYPDSEMLSDELLLKRLIDQKDRFKDTIFLYWNHRPLTHQKWIRLLSEAGIQVMELRTLNEFQHFFYQNMFLGGIKQ